MSYRCGGGVLQHLPNTVDGLIGRVVHRAEGRP